jgi:hypothetical protein
MMGSSSDAGAYWNANATFDAGWKYIINGASSRYEQGGGSHLWLTAPSGTAGNSISFTEAMTLGSNSGLSIGTVSAAPSQGLLVQGASTFNSAINGTSANFSNNIVFNRPSTSAGNNIEWKTANTLNWYIGTRGLVDNNFYFVNEGLGVNNLILNASTGAATFSSSVTATSFMSDGGGSEGVMRIERDTVGTNSIIGALNFTNNNGATIYGRVRGGRNSAGDGYVSLGTGVGDNLYALEGGNVGIGTASPTSGAGWTPTLVLNAIDTALLVKGANGQENSFGTSNGLYIDCLGNSTGTNNNIIFRSTSVNSSFSANERMRITSDGNIRLTSNNASNASFDLNYRFSTPDSARIRFSTTSDFNQNEPGELSFWTRANDAQGGGLITERMRITSAGNVGIGTTPSAFTGYTNLELANSSGSVLTLRNNANTAKFAIETDINGTLFRNTSNTSMAFLTNNNIRMVISSDGNIAINESLTTDILRVGGNTFTNTITTLAPTSNSNPTWRLGAAATGTVNANRLIRVEIAGVGYDLVARQII